MKDEGKKELSLKDRLKDKRERAKIELIFYGIFFVGIIIFARFLGSSTPNNSSNENANTETFINTIDDNYRYEMTITVGDGEYTYRGKVLGNNKTITKLTPDSVSSYYANKDKYYQLDNGNYFLTNKDSIYDIIDYRYLDIKEIKEYLKHATKEENTYQVKVSDLLLNASSDESITIIVDESNQSIKIDYTNLLNLNSEEDINYTVDITYYDINNLISLEE